MKQKDYNLHELIKQQKLSGWMISTYYVRGLCAREESGSKLQMNLDILVSQRKKIRLNIVKTERRFHF